MLALVGWETDERLTQAAVDLRKAADYLDTVPWCQFMTFDEKTGGVCAAGAINKVTDGVNNAVYYDHPSVIAIGAFQRITGEHLVTYNDIEGRTKQAVQAKLREVADQIDKEVARNV